jgi:predicted dinucleotide-binding enzyme
MNLIVIGRSNVGGGLAALWRKAGRQVTALGRGGGDASGAEVVVVAVPGPAISAALGTVTGLASKIAMDVTNAYSSCNEAFPSLAEEVKSLTPGPVAKSFDLNFAVLYGQIAAQRARPSSLHVAGDGASEVAEQLITDAGYHPVPLGGLDQVRALKDLTWLLSAAMKAGAPSSTASPSPANCEHRRKAGQNDHPEHRRPRHHRNAACGHRRRGFRPGRGRL